VTRTTTKYGKKIAITPTEKGGEKVSRLQLGCSTEKGGRAGGKGKRKGEESNSSLQVKRRGPGGEEGQKRIAE